MNMFPMGFRYVSHDCERRRIPQLVLGAISVGDAKKADAETTPLK